MGELFFVFLNVVTPVFILVLIGNFIGPRLNVESRSLSKIAYYVFVPAFVFNIFSESKIEAELASQMVSFIFVTQISVAMLGFLVGKILGRSKEVVAAFVIIATFGNVGNFGLQLILFRFGEVSRIPSTVYFLAILFISFVICVGAASWATSGGMQAVFSVFKTPALLALIPAMALNLSDVEVPIFLSRLSGLLGQAMIPVMLVTLGVQMSEIVKISINFNVIADYDIKDGSILIAAITSCTNTSNPNVLIGAGLLAKKAVELGLKTKPWVKTSLAPGSQVVTDYLAKAGLNIFLDQLGFNLVGYGCTTCIGNSGPLPENIAESVKKDDIYAVSVLSGNRNFEGRIAPLVKANYLASPPLVVAYALAGSMQVDLYKDSLGKSSDGKDVYLKDIWPSNKEIEDTLGNSLNPEMFVKRYSNVFKGPEQWQKIKTEKNSIYNWDESSTYVKKPPFFEGLTDEPEGFTAIKDARPLLILGDMITTDHISPAGSIQKESPTGEYFMKSQILPKDYNSYGSRRGNHEVMMRGTFANIRIRNEMAPGTEGGYTKLYPEGKVMPVYDAVKEYKKRKTDLVVIGGKEYGTGSSRDWAAKGTKLLGIKVVISESFERIHRSNLIGMGILPLQFINGINRLNLKLIGSELISVLNIEKGIAPADKVEVEIKSASGDIKKIQTLCRIDTNNELEYYKNGGILQYVLRNMF